MLNFNEIRKEFDASLTGITAYRAMIKEYLQCKVLEYIYRGPFKDRLVLIGGTKLESAPITPFFKRRRILYSRNLINDVAILPINMILTQNRTPCRVI